LAGCLGQENESLLSELQQISTGLDHIKQIVSAQQLHAKNNTLRVRVSPTQLFEQAVAMDAGTGADDDIRLVCKFDTIESAALDKHKVLQILINLLSNARKAVAATGRSDGQIELATARLNATAKFALNLK